MSDNKLLKENTIRRFMKLANVDTLTDNFIQEKYTTNEEVIEEQAEMEPGEEEAAPEPEMDMGEEPEPEMDMDMGEEPEMEMGAADISLTEEEAELLIDLGERLKEAMDMEGEDDELDMEDDMGEDDMAAEAEPEEGSPMEPAGDAPDTEDPAGYRALQENKDEIVREVLKRVTKRILNNRK